MTAGTSVRDGRSVRHARLKVVSDYIETRGQKPGKNGYWAPRGRGTPLNGGMARCGGIGDRQDRRQARRTCHEVEEHTARARCAGGFNGGIGGGLAHL